MLSFGPCSEHVGTLDFEQSGLEIDPFAHARPAPSRDPSGVAR